MPIVQRRPADQGGVEGRCDSRLALRCLHSGEQVVEFVGELVEDRGIGPGQGLELGIGDQDRLGGVVLGDRHGAAEGSLFDDGGELVLELGGRHGRHVDQLTGAVTESQSSHMPILAILAIPTIPNFTGNAQEANLPIGHFCVYR